LTSAKIFSGGALMLAWRWTRKVSGLVAAKPRRAASATTSTTTTIRAIVMGCRSLGFDVDIMEGRVDGASPSRAVALIEDALSRPSGSGMQIDGGPQAAVHVERHGAVLV